MPPCGTGMAAEGCAATADAAQAGQSPKPVSQGASTAGRRLRRLGGGPLNEQASVAVTEVAADPVAELVSQN